MADSSARIEFDAGDLARLKAALSRLTWHNLVMAAPLERAGEEMLDTFRSSFDKQASPAGVSWAPLAQRTQQAFKYPRKRQVTAGQRKRRRTKARARRGGDHILQARRVPGWLKTKLSMKVGPYSLEVGELGHIGGAAFRAEFGFGKTHEPSRPYVQLTDGMESKIASEILSDIDSRWK